MTDQQRVRGGDGRYLRTLEGAERQARAAELRSQGLSYRKIAATMADEGSAGALYNVKTAFEDVRTAMAAVVQESAEAAVQFELDRLDLLHRKAMEVLKRHHIAVSNGRVVVVGGEPLQDDGPVLAAIDRVVKISESRRRLLGLDQPAKTQVSGGLTYEVVGIDPETLR